MRSPTKSQQHLARITAQFGVNLSVLQRAAAPERFVYPRTVEGTLLDSRNQPITTLVFGVQRHRETLGRAAYVELVTDYLTLEVSDREFRAFCKRGAPVSIQHPVEGKLSLVEA